MPTWRYSPNRCERSASRSPSMSSAAAKGPPNWLRSGAAFTLDRAAVRIGSIVLFADGRPYDERAPEAASYLQGRDIDVEVDLGTGGSGRSHMWTCDLSAEYVRINAEYRT